MKKYILIIIFLQSNFKAFNQEFPFAEYYYNLNLAFQAKDKISRKTDSIYTYSYNRKSEAIKTAYNSLPIKNKSRINLKHYTILLKDYCYKLEGNKLVLNDSSKVISIIKSTPIITNPVVFKKSNFIDKRIQKFIDKYQKFIEIEPILKRHKKMIEEIDFIYLIDQYIRNGESADSLKVPKEYRYLSLDDGDDLVFYKMLQLFQHYPIKDNLVYLKYNMFLPLVHLTDFDKFQKLEPYINELLKEGFLTPNEFTWIYDRSYNNKYGAFYYYFSLNPPFNTSNFIPEKSLSPKQKEAINIRRKRIGIPPLPFSYTFIPSAIR